jgi:type II secretory pathway component GspD/PulD (secretin)
MVNSTPVMRPPLFTLALILFIALIYPNPSYTQETKPSRDPIVIQVIHLDYADAKHLASVLAPLLSVDGRLVAYRPTNSLIIKDRASLVKRLVQIIKGDPDPSPPYLSP